MSDSGERGVATVFAAFAVAAVMAIAVLGLQLGVAAGVRHRAEMAADLASLAAAAHATSGTDSACALARRVADAMATRLSDCRLAGWEALVEVHTTADIPLVVPGEAVGRARAGPTRFQPIR
ncbi:MAG: helicase/secretion neighborhood TadE-like protein [Pseudonocardia sp.]|nr:helicase/secretion neighborhood TadE-like protein [Pseudonocardia sp.]